METALLLAQIVATGGLTLWLTLGVRDNILMPTLNETYTAQVMAMTRMQAEYPEEYQLLAHRAVTDRKLQQAAFRLVVATELIVTLVLWAATFALILGLAGAVATEKARVLALLGAVGFTAIWSGFLIVGNHFSYWFCHVEIQNTHFQMTLWGLATLILLAQG